jgi:hypothetical protein
MRNNTIGQIRNDLNEMIIRQTQLEKKIKLSLTINIILAAAVAYCYTML